MNFITLGVLASFFAGLATGAGALPVLFTNRVSDRLLDAMLGFSSGVMLAATSFSLIIPALEMGGIAIAVLGLALGAFAVHLIDRFIPHLHLVSGLEGPPSKLAKVWLFMIAMTIHNFPEGMAVGVSFGTGDISLGTAVAVAIALQNMPEGLAVAMPLLREKYSKWKALWYATLTGLVEPVGGSIGVALVSTSRQFLPFGLALELCFS